MIYNSRFILKTRIVTFQGLKEDVFDAYRITSHQLYLAQ